MGEFFGEDVDKKIATERNNREQHTIWVEKYRPVTLDTFIGNELIKDKASQYIDTNDIPHLLFFGRAGGGKTTLATLLANNMKCDTMYINASDENSIDDVRTKVKGFASSIGFTDLKILVLDEADYLTPNAQAALRNVMETFSSTTRFILTCNYPEKITSPIISRCQMFELIPPSKRDIAKHLSNILIKEKVEFDVSDIAFLVNAYNPDIRRIINSAQKQTVDGVLKLNQDAIIESDYKLKVLELLKDKSMSKKDTFRNIRQLLADNKISDFSDGYILLADNIDSFALGNMAQIIIILADMDSKASFTIDKEMNFMSLIIQILDVIK